MNIDEYTDIELDPNEHGDIELTSHNHDAVSDEGHDVYADGTEVIEDSHLTSANLDDMVKETINNHTDQSHVPFTGKPSSDASDKEWADYYDGKVKDANDWAEWYEKKAKNCAENGDQHGFDDYMSRAKNWRNDAKKFNDSAKIYKK